MRTILIHIKYLISISRLSVFIACYLLSNHLLFAQSTVTFPTPGTTTWTVPECVTSITVQVWGGGGGGGAAWSRIQNGCASSCHEACSQGGGGGGGGFVSRTYAVTPGEVYTITVGAGGQGGAVSPSGDNRAQPGAPGQNSTFSGPATVAAGSPLTAFGGNGGGAGNLLNTDPYDWGSHRGVDGAGGAGGSGIGGTTTFIGGSGSSGRHSGSCYDVSGAGGGGAGTASNGGNGAAPASCVTRNGGAGGAVAGGNGANGGKLTGYNINYQGQAGQAGSALGGGGSGAMIHNNAAGGTSHRSVAGGSGARGEIRIIYTTPNIITPTFSPVGPICSGETLSPLPTTSNNGITGAWSPALNNTTTTTYTFTPDAGQCAEPTSLTITINNGLVPSFTPVPPVCNGEAVAALPSTSNNGITGSWNPTSVSNTSSATYTFIPNPGQCAVSTTLDITVTPRITPTFNPVPPFCEGTAIPVLPATSTNGISGTWNPSTVNNNTSGTYTFTPNPGQCADAVSIGISILTGPNTSVIYHN